MLWVGCSAPLPDISKNYILSSKTCQGTLQMHFQHSCIVFGGLGADHHDEIDILSTILVLVQNHSKSCPEMMKINENQWKPLIIKDIYWDHYKLVMLYLCSFFLVWIFKILKVGQKIVSRNCTYYVFKYTPGYNSIPTFFYIVVIAR